MALLSRTVSYAQYDTSEIGAIKAYAEYIDSINNSGTQNNEFLHSVEDGVIKRKRSGKTVGGYGEYMLMNLREDTIYRIEYNGGARITVNKVYYYKSNQLVTSKLELFNNKRVIYRREEFYKDSFNLLTIVKIKNEKKTKRHTHEIELSLFEDGLKFLDKFKDAHNRHKQESLKL